MDERELEQRLRTAVEHAAPDPLDRILAACGPQAGTVLPFEAPKKKRRWAPLAAAACLALVVAALFTVLSALLGLFLGLKMPNLHWTSEITPIKQGGAVALAMLSGMVYAALLAGGFFLIGWRMGYMAFMAAFAAVTLAACVLLLRWIKTKGCAVFANL